MSDETQGLLGYAAMVAAAVGDHPHTTVVSQSLSAFVAPLVTRLVSVDQLVLVTPMMPRPGGRAGDWMDETGQRAAARAFALERGRDPDATFTVAEFYLHDVPAAVTAEFAQHTRPQAIRPYREPWPLDRWPDVPTTCIVGRHDRLFPLQLQQRLIEQRLGSSPLVVEGGHLSALSAPEELVELILAGSC